MNIYFTELAKAFAFKAGGLNALGDRVMEELDELAAEAGESLEDLAPFSHTFEIEEQGFLCRPLANNAGVHVDTCTWVEGEELKAGPFKGKKICYPVGDSDDR
jgi:hypothetical protein